MKKPMKVFVEELTDEQLDRLIERLGEKVLLRKVMKYALRHDVEISHLYAQVFGSKSRRR